MQQFRRADARYNSGLFHFGEEKGRGEPPDTLTPGLAIDDKALRDILKNLYYPDSPYEFSVLPADILGQVYEQFLGKVIRLTAGHQAKVEEKPEVRKAGGVYYTPTYIVDYIVKQTVGKLVEGKRPGPQGGVSKLRILDPACGAPRGAVWIIPEPTGKARRIRKQSVGSAASLNAAEANPAGWGRRARTSPKPGEHAARGDTPSRPQDCKPKPEYGYERKLCQKRPEGQHSVNRWGWSGSQWVTGTSHGDR